jgi:hypothetical protein
VKGCIPLELPVPAILCPKLGAAAVLPILNDVLSVEVVDCEVAAVLELAVFDVGIVLPTGLDAPPILGTVTMSQ